MGAINGRSGEPTGVALFDLALAFVVSALAGTFAIFVAAVVVVGDWDVFHALVSAVIGGILWTMAAGISHPVATGLVLVGWVIALDVIYLGDWRHAAVVGFFAWACAFLVLASLQAIFSVEFGIFGIPGI